MKSTRKTIGTVAAKPAQIMVRPVALDDQFDANLDMADFFQQTPKDHLQPEEESFRSFLNSKLPKKKASQALMQRIRHTIQDLDHNL